MWIVLPAAFAKSDEDQWVPVHRELAEALAVVPAQQDEGGVDDDRFFPFKS